ncbi:hypothetical protein [Jiella endophytica]|nr:hypothetical protein [Jiella endophytica]
MGQKGIRAGLPGVCAIGGQWFVLMTILSAATTVSPGKFAEENTGSLT